MRDQLWSFLKLLKNQGFQLKHPPWSPLVPLERMRECEIHDARDFAYVYYSSSFWTQLYIMVGFFFFLFSEKDNKNYNEFWKVNQLQPKNFIPFQTQLEYQIHHLFSTFEGSLFSYFLLFFRKFLTLLSNLLELLTLKNSKF